jgi:hypothetical protein
MKTSNALLLLLLIISISFISSVPLVVNLKLRSRDFELDKDAGRYDHRKFSEVKFISLKGLSSVVLIPSDSLAVEIEASQWQDFRTDRSGDTLIVALISRTISGLKSPDFKVYVPAVERIICTDSHIDLKGSVTREGARSFTVDLINSQLVLQGRDSRLSPLWQFFDHLVVTGKDSSGISLSPQLQIRKLSLVNVKHTMIDGSRVVIDEINTTHDPKAIVKMKSLHGVIEISADP